MNTIYRSLFVSRVAAAIGAAKAVAVVTHSGVKGTIREILLRELFRPLLPADIGVGTGLIATNQGDLSPQQDVVIYDKRILPPVLFENIGIFPIESVLATVEVKTTLTAAELVSAYNNAATIQNYRYLSGERNSETGQPVLHTVKNLIATVFALGTDLSTGGKTELQRYQEIHSSGEWPIRAICVLGRGYWFFKNEWCYEDADAEHREIVAFLVGLLHTFAEVAETRRRPDLAAYIR